MKCPVCPDVNLVMSERNGIEIDYCPNCRGVWLDRGELDKIIERAAPTAAAPQQTSQPQQPYTSQDQTHDRSRDHGYGAKKKRGGFLGDLFDFD